MLKYFLLLFSLHIYSVSLLAQSDSIKQEVLTMPKRGVLWGEKLPEEFWKQMLTSYNVDGTSRQIVLSDFRDKFLVLDFWATYCSPCVASLDKWNKWQHEFHHDVQVLAIHLYDHNKKVLPFAKKRGWSIPLIYGNQQDTAINQLFYYDRSYGQVWIKDGKLFAIPTSWELDIDDVRKAVLKGIPPSRQNTFLTYEELKSKM